MKTFKFSLVLRTRENTDVFISLDDNIYGIHSKRINILYVYYMYIMCSELYIPFSEIAIKNTNTSLTYPHLPLDLALWLTLSGANCPCPEQIANVPTMFGPLKLDLIFTSGRQSITKANLMRTSKAPDQSLCLFNLSLRFLFVYIISGVL